MIRYSSLAMFLILFNIQSTAQVMSKDSLWIDTFFDSVDLIIIPEYNFTYTNISIDFFENKKVEILNSYLITDVTQHTLSKKMNMNVLHGGTLSLGLKSENIDFFVFYYTGWNQFRDESYDSPYNSANNIKIGDAQILSEKLGANTNYWFTQNYGIGIKYDFFTTNIKISKIFDRIGGLSYTSIASFYISHQILYLCSPVKFKVGKLNINLLGGFTLYSSGKGSTLIEAYPQYSKDFDTTPFGVKFNLGVNTKLFNYLPFGIMYKFNYLASKGEYSFMTNTISLQIGIPNF